MNGQVQIVQWLLSLGADVSPATDNGFTPLHGAVTKDLATAKVLYEAGADINARSKTGSTLLHEAALTGPLQVIKWLISLGLDLNVIDSDGKVLSTGPPLWQARRCSDITR